MSGMEITQRDIESLRTTLNKLDQTLETLRQEIASTYVRKDVLEPRLKDIEKDVDGHSEAFRWVVRLVLAAVILALLGVVIAQGGSFQ